jgi:hypothetical protein
MEMFIFNLLNISKSGLVLYAIIFHSSIPFTASPKEGLGSFQAGSGLQDREKSFTRWSGQNPSFSRAFLSILGG